MGGFIVRGHPVAGGCAWPLRPAAGFAPSEAGGPFVLLGRVLLCVVWLSAQGESS